LLFLGCGDFTSEGSDKSGSLFNVESIVPIYFKEATPQVDVFLDNCADDPAEPVDPEPYTDHFAEVTLSNRPYTNSEEQTATPIKVLEYRVRYEPLTLGSPELEPFTRRDIAGDDVIDPCLPDSDCPGETLTGIYFVPIREKGVLRDYLFDACDLDPEEWEGDCQLAYNIYYTFWGENDYGYPVRAERGARFFVTNYDNCGN